MTMRLLNVVQIERERIDRQLAELPSLQADIASHDVAFHLTTEPEAPGPTGSYLDKLTERLATFRAVRERFHGTEVRVGMLAQSTIGHAERHLPRSSAPFQRMADTDGTTHEGSFCPLDPGFQDHLVAAFRLLADQQPAFILVDDDFRLAHPHNRQGCFCPLHLRLLQQRHGVGLSREQLLAAVADDSADGRRIRAQWHDVESESLLGPARKLRAAIDEVNPDIPVGICATPTQRLLNDRLARALAGPHRPLVRTAGAVYFEGTAKNFPDVVDLIARQRQHLGDDVETLLEADTFPHHGFSVSATMLTAHLTTGAVLGMDGAKAWVVPQWTWRGKDNPQFVQAYAKLAELMPAIEPIAAMVRWRGLSTPIADDEPERLPWTAQDGKQFLKPGWAGITARLGIAQVPGGAPRELRAFNGISVQGYSDTEWEEFFRHGVLLDGAAACHLTERGFATMMGTEAVIDPELRLTSELYRELPSWNGTSGGAQRPAMRLQPDGIARLTPVSDRTTILGDYISQPWRQSPDVTLVAPAVTTARNELGGRVAVYAADIDNIRPIQHFIDPFRRPQLVKVLDWLAPEEFPLHVDCHTDCYVLVGDLAEPGDHLVYAINLQADPIDAVTIRARDADITDLAVVDNGTWQPARTQITGSQAAVEVSLGYLDTVLLRVTTS